MSSVTQIHLFNFKLLFGITMATLQFPNLVASQSSTTKILGYVVHDYMQEDGWNIYQDMDKAHPEHFYAKRKDKESGSPLLKRGDLAKFRYRPSVHSYIQHPNAYDVEYAGRPSTRLIGTVSYIMYHNQGFYVDQDMNATLPHHAYISNTEISNSGLKPLREGDTVEYELKDSWAVQGRELPGVTNIKFIAHRGPKTTPSLPKTTPSPGKTYNSKLVIFLSILEPKNYLFVAPVKWMPIQFTIHQK